MMIYFKGTVAAIILLLGYAHAQNATCDFTQVINAGRTYYVYSPGYPSSYPPGIQCRWIADCRAGYNCNLDCTEINLPQSQGCTVDKLMISRVGDPQLTSAEYYCGKGTLTGVVSTKQQLAIALVTSNRSPGGRFYCELTAIPATSTPSPPTACNCGYKKVNRIVGGTETKPNEYPMMAGVAYKEESAIRCGGVIISNQQVLTAAHCVIGRSPGSLAVIVGEHDITTGSDSPATQGFAVASYIVHPKYSDVYNDYDIAILTIQGSIKYSEYVGPVCLPFKFANTDLTGAKVKILGWGSQFIGGPTSNTLQQVTVDVISDAQCRRDVPTLTPRQLCTYTPGKDACQVDSGGPLLLTDPATGREFVVGIVSYGKFCASRAPAVNTRVTALLDWIVNNTPADFCRV